MADYDFHQLSPHDFENMARDLLQADWGVKLESFKTGKDGGIDFRYAQSGFQVIVQCKHYVRTGLTGLLRDLGKEAAKVRKLKPQRYILITSVPLSPPNKEDIVKIIGSDVLNTGDILGQEDLNNRLSHHPSVENRHYKLWLASRAVLDRVLHNASITQSEFKARQVYKEIPRYVQSDAFPKALTILDRDRFVIVTGSPGVGKTTLANLLLYKHLEHGYQAVVIQRDIQEGLARFQEGAQQVFYYDDFMGTTFLGDRGTSFRNNEDRAILEFIAMVRTSPTTRMILTTREHIFSQALEKSERLRHSKIGDDRVVLRMSDYSFGQRANILYNHLYFSDLPEGYQEELLRNDFYFQIIKHEKFNPRLIEWLSTYQRVKNIEIASYRDFVSNLLRDPSEIWRHAYEHQISDAGRSLLLTLFSLGGKAGGDLLEETFSALHTIRAERYGFQRRPEDFSIAFHELKGAFIKPISGHSVEVLDPSVLDLLNAVVRNATDNAFDLIGGAARFAQIERIWSFAESAQGNEVMSALSQKAEWIAETIEPRMYDSRKVTFGNGTVVYKGATFEKRLAVLIGIADRLRHPLFLQLIEKSFARLNEEWLTEAVNIGDGIAILRAYNWLSWSSLETMFTVYEGCRNAIVTEAAEGCSSDDLRDLISALDGDDLADEQVKEMLRKGLETYQRDYFAGELRECRASEQFDGLLGDLAEFQRVLNVDTNRETEKTLEAKEEFEENESAYADHMQDEWKERHYEQHEDENSVREMFGSLISDR